MSETTHPVDVALQGLTLDDATVDVPMNQDAAETSGDLLEEVVAQPEQAEAEPTETDKKEPGYVKRRIEAAIAKDREAYSDKLVAEVSAKYEAMLKPLLEERMERQADQLVRDGEFKSRERALEYLHLKGGVPVETVKAEPTRDEQGRFMSKSDAESRAQVLIAQARAIHAATGVDVMAAYHSDDSVRQRILGGADFSEIVPELLGKAPEKRAAPPAPMRSPNNAVPPKRGPLELNKDELERLDRNLARGVRVDMRR